MGCHCSKNGGVVEPTNADGDQVPALKVAVLSVEGLRCANCVFVEVEVRGQRDSKVRTPTVSSRARTHGIGERARETVEADLQCELAVKGYLEGAAITFTVRDGDPSKAEFLGRATLPATMVQAQFWGKIPLADAGVGYEASLEVRVGERHILPETAQEITNALSDAVEGVQEAFTEAKDGIKEVVCETADGVKVGVTDESATEVKDAVSHGFAEAAGIAQEAFGEAKSSVVDNAGEIRIVAGNAYEEVKETKGAVCCEC